MKRVGTIAALVFCVVSCDSGGGPQSTSNLSSAAGTRSVSTSNPEDMDEGDSESMVAGLRRLRHRGCECATSACLVSAYEQWDKLFPRLKERAPLADESTRVEIARLMREISGCLPSKTQEARDGVKRIYDAARAHYLTVDSSNRPQASFPPSSAGPTPPLGACCRNGGACDPDPSLWTRPEWKALAFSLDRPHFYSFEYRVTQASGPNATFTARAIGDLDCNGAYSTFQMVGELNAPHGASP